MIYVDTSCLIKLLRPEPTSEDVAKAIGHETAVIVSALCELEAAIQLKASYLGGDYSHSQWKKLDAALEGLRQYEPFVFRSVPAGAWESAFQQHRQAGTAHCRTLDRLHLGIMAFFGLTRLMTHDNAQATAALALGFKVVKPGR